MKKKNEDIDIMKEKTVSMMLKVNADDLQRLKLVSVIQGKKMSVLMDEIIGAYLKKVYPGIQKALDNLYSDSK
jgi:hypothetical protein